MKPVSKLQESFPAASDQASLETDLERIAQMKEKLYGHFQNHGLSYYTEGAFPGVEAAKAYAELVQAELGVKRALKRVP